ncbi:MAG TPA: hypothetical protein PK191_01800 [Niabella sp.]|nr:hypothetical protein [Niabella sp.]HOZ97383.1 hypothetical protein [Niabella sp.]HQW15249.1 hypothetical protein [Niabella sp.]HQX20283.1 hypothetical protein [Niabella sp.]HQX42428.1 hypothetical protein [Niabella sp.]
MNTEIKKCLACGKPVKGRSDKKFCDDYCRNVFNNQAKTTDSLLVRNINNALKRNRNILASLLSGDQDTAKVNREKMMSIGFQFKWHTHLYTTQKGTVYYFCYDYGYLPMENNWYLIVKYREQQEGHSSLHNLSK